MYVDHYGVRILQGVGSERRENVYIKTVFVDFGYHFGGTSIPRGLRTSRLVFVAHHIAFGRNRWLRGLLNGNKI